MTRGELLHHPLYLGSVLLLVGNDHYLKRAHPGLVSGRLSDFAGLCFFPVLLWSLLELARAVPLAARPRIVGLTAMGALSALVFALVELWPPATRAYQVVLGALASAPSALAAWLSARPASLHLASQTPDAGDLWALPCAFAGAMLAACSSSSSNTSPISRR